MLISLSFIISSSLSKIGSSCYFNRFLLTILERLDKISAGISAGMLATGV